MKTKYHHYNIPEGKCHVVETDDEKLCRSLGYNYIFDKRNGKFARWGESLRDDPSFAPFGPELLDLEISVDGCPDAATCPFCYKDNAGGKPTNMTFGMFRAILDKFPRVLTQVAFGITGVQTNPDFLDMMRYCRSQGIIPNFTLTGTDLTGPLAREISKVVGAVAVSIHEHDPLQGYDTVRCFHNYGVEQVNVHLVASKETLGFVRSVIEDIWTNGYPVNAVVLLGMKPKGRARGKYTSLTVEELGSVVNTALDLGVGVGFDSCTAPKFEALVETWDITEEEKSRYLRLSESCESSLFSAYVNVHGEYWHCSFAEDEPSIKSVNLFDVRDFYKDLWYSPQVISFRNRVLNTAVDGTRSCIVFPEINLERKRDEKTK
jgi:hypothetical protein